MVIVYSIPYYKDDKHSTGSLDCDIWCFYPSYFHCADAIKVLVERVVEYHWILSCVVFPQNSKIKTGIDNYISIPYVI